MEKTVNKNLDLKPREKLIGYGAHTLSDQELLAILLGTGTKGRSVFEIAKNILPIIDSKNGSLVPEDLLSIKGLGQAKSCTLAAAYEFTRRRIRPLGVKIKSPRDILPLISHIANRPQEHFISISLNGAHEVITSRVITIGLVNSSQIHPREVFSSAITDRATSIIIAHNHPSGNLIPSEEDKKVTTRLSQSGDLLGIKVLDHIIFSLENYYSFQEQGMM